MRILGGKDYYDNALQYGIDDDIVFARKHLNQGIYLDFPGRSFSDDFTFFKGKESHIYRWHEIKVYLAGKVYVGGCLIDGNDHKQCNHFIWHRNDVTSFMKKNRYSIKLYGEQEFFTFEDYCNVLNAPTKWRKELNHYKFSQGRNFFEHEMNWFIKNKATIVTCDSRLNHHNTFDPKIGHAQYMVDSDNLKDLEFFRVLDSYTCYNEIYNWVSGVLPSAGNPMVEISNDDKIHKAGFDMKTSFRHPVKLSKL